ncbi:MAG: M48 family metallopeptidase [Armatimonadota bacterium]
MARRVSKRRLKRKKPEVELTVEDYRVPGEKRVYWEGVGGLFALFAIAAYNIQWWMVGIPLHQNIQPDAALYGKWWIPLIVLFLPAVTWLIANFIALRRRNARIKQEGLHARVLNKNYPKLKTILAEQSKLLNMDEPEMYVLDEEDPYIYSMPGKSGKIVTTAGMLDSLNDEELALMIAREMGHIKAHHPRMMIVVNFILRANPVVKALLFPIAGMAPFLRGWMDLAEASADRMAVLMGGRPALVNAALVKLEVAVDREAEISKEELEAYLDTSSDMATDAGQIERHFKMGEFLGKHPALRERIEEIREFLRTSEGQEAMEKMTEAKQKLA